jgi:hypothetical protein
MERDKDGGKETFSNKEQMGDRFLHFCFSVFPMSEICLLTDLPWCLLKFTVTAGFSGRKLIFTASASI